MDDEGVRFPLHDGRRSTQHTARDVLARAAAAADPDLAAAIRAEDRWRTAYPGHIRRLTECAAASTQVGTDIARAGLAAVHATFEFARDGVPRPLADAIAEPPTRPLGTRTVAGDAAPADGLVVPYRGVDQRGDDIVRTARDWHARGIVEAPVVEALARVVAHPEWLDLRDRWFAVLGAGAEMAPTELLLCWGAEVAGVDVPRHDVWRRLEELAAAGSGRLHVPVDDGAACPLGVDLITDAPRVRAWLSALDRPLVFGNYAYADGATFVRLSVAADAVCAALRRERDDVSVTCLATPTDTFAVPATVVEQVRRAPGWPVLARGVNLLSAARLLVPNYRRTVRTADGRELGIADSLVLQQGANYALAKRLQRWRAVVTRADGTFAAIHVAPPTRTRSVLKNRVLAAAYAGAPLFGVETFEPATSRAVMAALLVHDLRMHEQGGAAPAAVPEHELTAAAVHGGLWRVAWEPRSALPLAVLRGAPTLLRRHVWG
jgi:hypothetical protein